MTEPANDACISQITTAWALLLRARGSDDDARAARELLVARYRGAVHRYLRKAVGEADADDLTREFAVLLIDGKLRGADPARGRFRNYVRRVLSNLVARDRRGG